MEKRKLVMAIVVVVGLFSSVTFAGGPLGPPKALAGRGKWLVDVEYAHENMDLKACGKREYLYLLTEGDWVPDYFRARIEDVRLNMFFGSLAYGLCDNWDVFVRVGAADAKDEVINEGSGEKYQFDGSYGFAWGVGTRATFCQCGPWTFGAVGQVTWLNPGDDKVSWVNPADANDAISGKLKLDWRQFQAGLGVTYQADGWWVYGGPCLYFVNGDFDFKDTELYAGTPQYLNKFEGDVREESEFGGWVGVGCDLPQNAKCYAEAQIYGDGWAIAGGVLFPLAVQ